MKLDKSHYAEKFKEIMSIEKRHMDGSNEDIERLTKEITDEIINTALLYAITSHPNDTINEPMRSLCEEWKVDPEFVKSFSGNKAAKLAYKINEAVRKELSWVINVSPTYVFILTVLMQRLYEENQGMKQEIRDIKHDMHNLSAQTRSIEQRVELNCHY